MYFVININIRFWRIGNALFRAIKRLLYSVNDEKYIKYEGDLMSAFWKRLYGKDGRDISNLCSGAVFRTITRVLAIFGSRKALQKRRKHWKRLRSGIRL